MNYGEEIKLVGGLITVRRRMNDYMAFLTGDERIWANSHYSIDDAVGNLWRTHPDWLITAVLTTQTLVESECRSCGASGLYSGVFEARDQGVICWKCKGSGKIIPRIPGFKPFTGRKVRDDIKRVTKHGENWVVSYQDFLDGEMPS